MIPVDRGRVRAPKAWNARARSFRDAILQTRSWDTEVWRRARQIVKPAIVELFQNKCAYCETPVTGDARGEIDHYRPRHNAAGLDADDVRPDHYLWLGYEWTNLYLSCLNCNRHKRNLFPIAGRPAPFGASGDALAAEEPLLLDPCTDDPAQSLAFLRSGRVRARDERGKITIHALGLNRSSLVKSRAEIAEQCLTLLDRASMASSAEQVKAAAPIHEALKAMADDSAPYSATARELVGKRLPALLIRQTVSRPADRARRRAKKKKTARRAGPGGRAEAKKAPRKKKDLDHKAEMLEAVWLDEIEIVNFRPLRECRLRFPGDDVEPAEGMDVPEQAWEDANRQPWLALIGRNGIGKSSILKAIALALTTPATRQAFVPDASSCVNREAIAERKRRKRRTKAEGHIALTFTDGHTLTLRFREGQKDFEVEGVRPRTLQAVGYGSTRLPAGMGRRPPKRASRVVMQNLLNPFVPLSDVNLWLADTAKLRSTPFKVLSQGLADLLSYPPEEQVITRRSKRLFAKGIPVDELSDGYRSLAGLATDLMRHLSVGGLSSKHFVGTVLLDEIETHLHPEWKLKIVDTLRRVFPNVRFIVATHDPLCLRGLWPGEVHRLFQDPELDRTVLHRADVPAGLDAAELLTGNWFGLSSTLDADTRNLMGTHRKLLRKSSKTAKDKRELETVRDTLRRRLYGTPTVTTPERMVTDFVMQAYDEQIHEFTPKDRKTLQSKLQKRLARVSGKRS